MLNLVSPKLKTEFLRSGVGVLGFRSSYEYREDHLESRI